MNDKHGETEFARAAAGGRHRTHFSGIPSYVQPAAAPAPSDTPAMRGTAAAGFIPELHAVIAEKGVFLITHDDGTVHTFLNLAISGVVNHAIMVFFDPATSDECQVFDCWRSQSPRLTQLDQKTYRGAGILIAEMNGLGNLRQIFRFPTDLKEDDWAPAAEVPFYLTCYFRDKMGRLAVGYRSRDERPESPVTYDYEIISGARDLVPHQWQRAHVKASESIRSAAPRSTLSPAMEAVKGGAL